jgi:5-methylcytosine-specific restriction endonuclease McrA
MAAKQRKPLTPEQKEKQAAYMKEWWRTHPRPVRNPEKAREYQRRSRAKMSPEKVEEINVRKREYQRKYHAEHPLTPEQKAKLPEYQRRSRENRSPEEKERAKVAKNEYMRQRSLNATPEEKAAKREYMRQWCLANGRKPLTPEQKEKHLLYNKQQYAENYKVRARTIASAARRYVEKRDDVLATAKKRRNGPNREKILAAARAWAKAHPEEKLAHVRNRHALKRSSGTHTAADVTRLYDAQRGVCAGCEGVLVAKGRGKYHVDHVMPLILGGSNGPENLQLLCPPCNLSKGTQHPDAWARERGRRFA